MLQLPLNTAITELTFFFIFQRMTYCYVRRLNPTLPYEQVALYRVVSIGTSPADVTLQLLGFYDIVQPRLVSFSPKDVAAAEKKRPGEMSMLLLACVGRVCLGSDLTFCGRQCSSQRAHHH